MAALLKEGKTQAYIAAELGRSEATISREINRNGGREAYDPNQAQENYENRRKVSRRPHKLDDPEFNARGKHLFLQCCWSPEQMQYHPLHENSRYSISYATICHAIHAGRFNDPDWVKSGKQRLRHRGKKRPRKGAPARGGFAIDHELSERPEIAEERGRLGDWEADTVAGITGGAVLVTLTDRKSRYLLCARAEKKTAENVRPGQRVRAACNGGGGAGGKNILILPAAVSAVATRDEREHQWPATGILPETSGHCAVF